MSSKENEKPKPTTIESAVEHAKRAFALRKYEQAVQHYATALEIATENGVSDQSTEMADLYFEYGRALLENAIAQSGVLGKEQPEAVEEEEAPAASSSKGPILSFEGDAEDEDEAVNLADVAGEEEEGDEEEDDENAEPEDDFNAAWEVLDLARVIYEKQTEETLQLKLAEVHILLGDISLETEKFEQAVVDYQTAVDLKSKLLPVTSREIAEAHYKFSLALDHTPGRLSDSIKHAQLATDSLQARIDELSAAPATAEGEADTKGKGKATATSGMTQAQIQAEIKELAQLKEELSLKIEELKTTPNETTKASAPELAAQALDQELKSTTPSAPLPVNDLTGMVKKKKKDQTSTPDSTGSSKRKAEDEAVPETAKRTKSEGVDEPAN